MLSIGRCICRTQWNWTDFHGELYYCWASICDVEMALVQPWSSMLRRWYGTNIALGRRCVLLVNRLGGFSVNGYATVGRYRWGVGGMTLC